MLTESSLASAVVRLALAQGAEVLLTAPLCRAHRLTSRVAPRLGIEAPVLELDVTIPEDLATRSDRVRDAGWDRVDGVLHAIAYAPESALGDTVAAAEWDDVATALQASTWSLAALAHALRPLLPRGASIVGLDFDGTKAWPKYGWMGVAKAGLESTSRYLAKELGPDGIRVNLVAAGPIRTMAARGIPGFQDVESSWHERAPLGWDTSDSTAVAQAVVALLSDWFPMTTGEVVHVDGGAHAVG